jgi:pimeloyl-ACP methyl ester carboxylesterase
MIVADEIQPRGTCRMVHYRSLDASGHKVFNREAGDPKNLTLSLLHGFPTSSDMLCNLIPLLADCFALVAPDLPGFGNTVSPPRGRFDYTFDNPARVIGGFVDGLGLDRYAWYVFDYGASAGRRGLLSRYRPLRPGNPLRGNWRRHAGQQ